MFNNIPQEILDNYIKTIVNIRRASVINPISERAKVIAFLDKQRQQIHNKILDHVKADRNNEKFQQKLARYLENLIPN